MDSKLLYLAAASGTCVTLGLGLQHATEPVPLSRLLCISKAESYLQLAQHALKCETLDSISLESFVHFLPQYFCSCKLLHFRSKLGPSILCIFHKLAQCGLL